MSIETIKQEMEHFKDFYGGDLLDGGEIDGAKTREELASIIERHRSHMEMMLCDANSHLDNFKKKLGLQIL